MTRAIGRLIGATLLSIGLTAFVTWPQASLLRSHFAAHHDAFFSTWRIAWIAHALLTSPLHLFDANIFYPTPWTLAYSDATLLEGLLGAPLFWSGLSPVLIYNLLLLGGFVGSGVAMFVLARALTGETGPALIAATAFVLAPYRLEHFMHLELQWIMFMPLTLWALHRAVERSSWRFGALAGLFLGLQALACVYYGVFLAMLLVVFVPLLLLTAGRRAPHAASAIVSAVAIAVLIAAPYAWVYAQTPNSEGGRDIADIARYSAVPQNYLSSTGLSRLWGWTSDRWGGSELRLYPGIVAFALGCIGLRHRPRRIVWIYAAVAGAAVVLSFGLNAPVYRWLADHIGPLRGLRSTSRFGILAVGALSVMAAFGVQVLEARIGKGSPWRRVLVPALLAAMCIDCAMRPVDLVSSSIASETSLYKSIRASGPGVIVELPLPNLNHLPGWDAYYSLWSLQHWQPLVNGYSGYYPRDYANTMARMESFPDDGSMARLRAHNVRYLVVHHAFLGADGYTAMLARISGRPEFRPLGEFQDPMGIASLFVLDSQ